MKAMILAAGLGTRMRPLTDHCPKPLLDVGGKPLIVHHIERLAAAGLRDIVINTAHLGHLIEQQLGDGHQWQVKLYYSRESTPLETAGGIVNALPLLGDDPFVLLNGDIWTDFPLARLCQHTLAGAGHLVLVTNPPHHPDGDFVLAQERVSPRDGRTGLTFSGLSLLHPRLFDRWRARRGEAFPLREVLEPAMARGRITGECHSGYWLDVGTPERLATLREHLSPPSPGR